MKTLAITLLVALASATGCSHLAAAPQAAVAQTMVAGDAVALCSPATMQTHFYHGEEGVQRRVIDRHRCGVIELRVIDDLDVATNTRVREILRDVDHDGVFEKRIVEHDALDGSFAVLARKG